MKIVVRLAIAICAVALLLASTGCYSTPEGGEVGVVRNGKAWYNPFDWLDNHNIRGTISNGSGNTWTGMGSDVHYYPASIQQRIYKFDRTDDADARPVIVPSRDGVQIRVTGTFYLRTAFDGSSEGKQLLKDFDTSVGTRTWGTNGKHPYDGGGWSDFLNAVLQPVIDSNFRQIIAEFDCRELVSSCALVQRGGQQVKADEVKGTNNASNISQIQNRINENLAIEIKEKLGKPYFRDIRFSLGAVQLPGVQHAINEAQSAFAAVSKAQARVEQARADAQANEIRQRGYDLCHVCGDIDKVKALPRGLTAYGSGFAVGVK